MLAAPAFAGAASGAEIIQTFAVAERVLVMGRVRVRAGSKLDGSLIEDVERELDLSVVLLQSGDSVDVHPAPETALKADDVVAVVAELKAIKALAARWNARRR
jgi:Trk K+ transport system NAD-binding subunit